MATKWNIWPPNGPTTTHRLRAAIIREPSGDYPWDVSVDYVDPETGRRNVDIDSCDYGNFATHAEAIDYACAVLKKGAAL